MLVYYPLLKHVLGTLLWILKAICFKFKQCSADFQFYLYFCNLTSNSLLLWLKIRRVFKASLKPPLYHPTTHDPEHLFCLSFISSCLSTSGSPLCSNQHSPSYVKPLIKTHNSHSHVRTARSTQTAMIRSGEGCSSPCKGLCRCSEKVSGFS